jgi:2-alkyl-3-oxoalkanoate reductase
MAMNRIALVGAGGFLGNAVMAAARESGCCAITAVIRHARSVPLVLGCSDAVVISENRPDKLSEAFSDCDAVIDVSVGSASEILLSSSNVAQACQTSGVDRLVYTSSAAAQSVRRNPIGFSRTPTYYGREKLRAEEMLRDRLGGTEVAVIRPGVIWGPRSHWTIRHITELAGGKVMGPADDSGRASPPNLAFSENLAIAMLNWATGNDAGGSFYFSDPWWTSWENYFVELATAINVPTSNVTLCRRLRPGPLTPLLVEWLGNHPWMTRAALRTLRRLPEPVVGAITSRVFRSDPPPVIAASGSEVPVDSKPTVVRTGRFVWSEIDLFTRWAEPQPQLMDEVRFGQFSKQQAIQKTILWLTTSGYLEYLGVATDSR